MKRFLSIILLMVFANLANAQLLKITRVVVGEDGSVELRWQYDGSFDSFVNYVIEKEQGGAYQVCETLTDYSVNSYTDMNSSAADVSVKYKITATANPVSFVDSVATMCLSVTNVSANKVAAFLMWNSPKEGSYDYTLSRKIMGKTEWQEIAVTNNIMYTDTIRRAVCGDTVLYRIECGMEENNVSYSNSVGSLFDDPMPTTPCRLDVVSVDEETQKIKLLWHPSPDDDICGYFICQGNPCMALDTIYGKYDTSYVADNHSSLAVFDYRIYAFDSCFTPSALTEYYHNMVLTGKVLDCSNDVEVRWNSYINMPDGLSHYAIYARFEGEQNYRQMGTVPEDNELKYIFTAPYGTTQVDVKVLAVSNKSSRISVSNVLNINMSSPDTAEYIYIRLATVAEDNGSIDLTFLVDTNFETTEYLLYRKENSKSYYLYDKIPYSGKSTIQYTDDNVDVKYNRYFYRLAVKDGCGAREKRSNEASPVYLTLKTEDNVNIISRTNYIGWDTVESYNLFRRHESSDEWEQIAVLGWDEYYYSDHLSAIPHLTERIYYRVDAVEGPTVFSESLLSNSNYVVYTRKGEIWLPTAFTPQSDINNVFKPYSTFIKSEGYTFQIYNRMGLKVFETTDLTQGWNGTFKGNYVQQGAYVYVIYCTFSDGTSHVQKGTVVVVN